MTSERLSPAFVGPLIGLLTAAAALAFAEVTAVLAGASAPVVTVAEAVVEVSPPGLVEGAVSVLGPANEAVLSGGVVVLLAAASCLLGGAARHRPWGYAGLAVFAGCVSRAPSNRLPARSVVLR